MPEKWLQWIARETRLAVRTRIYEI